MSSSSSSRIPEMYSRFRSTIQQLDELESRISNRVASLRRRTTHLVEEVPTHRRTHMRIFISHRLQEGDDREKDGKQTDAPAAPTDPATTAPAPAMKPGGGKDFGNLLNSSAHEKAEKQAEEAKRKESDDAADGPKKGIRRWTLVIEGGLLIKHLDHVSAKEVDRRLENGLPILGCMQDDDNDNNGGKTEGGLKRELWPGGVAERQDEKVIDPLLFTHLFDKLEVELSIVKKSKKTEVAPPSTKKTFTWERSKANTADSNAFFIVHDEDHEFKPMGGKVFKSEFNVDHIDAKIKLFRRQGDDEENFIPTPSMCEVFFPSFIGLKSDGDMKTKDKIKKSKKRKLTLSVSGSSLDKSANTSTQSSWMDGSSSTLPNPGAAATNNNIVATGVAPIGEAPPQVKLEEKEGVPNTITMDEAVAAVFFYVRSRGLQDPHDASIINNDEQLSKLFGCNRMLLSAVRPLLIQKGLLVKVEPCTHPIIFNYAMTQDGKEPLEPKKNDVDVKKEDDAKSGRRRTSTVEKAASADEEEEEEAPMQTMLSCDIDVQVPNLYHNRSKDVLRRIKNREFEYTSARTRAFRSLLATFVHEDTARQVLGDAARGRGYAPYHKKAWMALAQGSVEGGEAQKAAMIDLRTTSLVEKLEEKKFDPSMMMNTAVVNNIDGTAADLSTASVEEWNPLEEVDSALLTALCDAKERKALVRLETILVDFMKDPSLTSIDVGGAFNSIVVGLRPQQTSENEPTGGGVTDEEDATTFVPSQSQGLQDLLNQYQRGVRQTSFQRLILHRLADRFNIVREQINNVNPNPTPAANSERNTSERGLVDVGVNNNNNNWSPQQQQQQNSYPLGLIRLMKKEESCTPPHLLINLDLSLLVNYKNPRARNFVPQNNSNNAEEGMRTLSDNMNAASLDNAAGVTSMPGPKKPNKKMVIMKRNSSSNTSGSGEGGANGKREGRSRRKKLEDREKAYEEARARIFGKEEKKEAERISDEKGESAAIQESLSPLNSCHSSFSAEENNEAPPTDLESADVSNGSHIVPSQLISETTPKIRSASPSPEPPGSAVPASQVETEGEQKQGQSKTKAVYRNRQQEENDPDFRRRSAYVPAAAMGVTPSGHMPPGVPYNMVNPYAVNPYSTVPGQHVMMQQQPPHFYPHPGQVTPQDPQSLHYPGYSQPRVFYPAQPQQPQSQPRSTEPQVQPSVVPRKTNDSSQAVAPRPENIAPQVNDARQPQTPSWGPNARLEVKSSEPAAAPTNVATSKKATPAKITTPPAKNEKREIKTTTLYKDEDFPALG